MKQLKTEKVITAESLRREWFYTGVAELLYASEKAIKRISRRRCNKVRCISFDRFSDRPKTVETANQNLAPKGFKIIFSKWGFGYLVISSAQSYDSTHSWVDEI